MVASRLYRTIPPGIEQIETRWTLTITRTRGQPPVIDGSKEHSARRTTLERMQAIQPAEREAKAGKIAGAVAIVVGEEAPVPIQILSLTHPIPTRTTLQAPLPFLFQRTLTAIRHSRSTKHLRPVVNSVRDSNQEISAEVHELRRCRATEYMLGCPHTSAELSP